MTLISTQIQNTPIQFGEWQFNPEDGQLISKIDNLRLQPRLAKLLAEFLANPDQLLSRDNLIQLIWGDKSVNEDSLSRCIAELRNILGDDRQAPIYIETVPKKGYRFIHPLNQTGPKKNTKTAITAITAISLALFFIAMGFAVFLNNQPKSPSSLPSVQLATVSLPLKTAIIGAQRLTSSSEIEHYPQFSNLGELVAYSVLEQQRSVVKIIDLTGALIYEINDPLLSLFAAAFSPDDKSLLIAGLNKGDCTIYRYQLPSLQKNKLTHCAAPTLAGIFSWAPDGKSFAYVAKDAIENTTANNLGAIWLYDVEKHSASQLTFPQNSLFDTSPKFSDDGRRLAFTRGTRSYRNIYTIELQTSDRSRDKTLAKPITQGRSYISGINWHNDNQHLIFDSNQLGDRNLWLVNIDSGEKQLLGARDAQNPSFNSKKDRLVYQELRYNANIWRVSLTESQATNGQTAIASPLISSIKYNNFPRFSPSGDQVAFVSNRQGKAAIWRYDLATQQQTKLLAISELDLIMPSWSPDGKKLLLSSRGDTGYRCYQLDIQTGRYQPISQIQPAHYNCEMAPNGDIFAVLKEPSKPSHLIKLSTDGQVTTLVEQNISRMMLTDSGHIIFSLAEQDGLFSVDIDGNNQTSVLNDYPRNREELWTLQGNQLYYPKYEEQRGIWRHDLASGEAQFITNELPTAIGQSLTVSPDQTQILLSKTDDHRGDIYLAKINSN